MSARPVDPKYQAAMQAIAATQAANAVLRRVLFCVAGGVAPDAETSFTADTSLCVLKLFQASAMDGGVLLVEYRTLTGVLLSIDAAEFNQWAVSVVETKQPIEIRSALFALRIALEAGKTCG